MAWQTSGAREGEDVRVGKTVAPGTSGQSYVKGMFEELGWGVAANPEHDLGTDLLLLPRDERRFDPGLVLGAQVKNGTSFFKEHRARDGRWGWWHREDRDHLEYWLHHVAPHILVLRNRTGGRMYWAHVNEAAVEWTAKRGKIFVPEDQILDASALPALMDIAASARPGTRWAGSAWNGVHDLARADALRYALLTPRLVAPHANAGTQTPGAPGAIALMTAGRFGEIDRYRLLAPDPSRTGWDWDFFAAMLSFTTTGDLTMLRACASSAPEPHQAAAAAVALAAALVEEDAWADALNALALPLRADECAPIDHAWLQLQRARCLAETGSPEEAIALATTVQAQAALRPDDVTAAALAGSAASLTFRYSGLLRGDVAATIAAIDAEPFWWRSQALSWALGSAFDEWFRTWSRRESEVRFTRDTASRRLRGITLVDGFMALHENWCHTTSLLAKVHLTGPELSVDDAGGCLTDLFRAGDQEAVQATVRHLLDYGPALAITQAAGGVNLDHLAHTEARAALELLIEGAEVLTTASADAAARWAVQEIVDLDRWVQRVRPTFRVESQRAALVRAVIPVVSPEVRAVVRQYLANLPRLADLGDEQAWAGAISAVPIDEWTADEVDILVHRSGDSGQLARAIKAIGVQRDSSWRATNDQALRDGSVEALAWVGPIANVPEDAVDPLIAALAKSLRSHLVEVRSGVHTVRVGQVDPAHALVLLGTQFPSHAQWDPVLELLNEPTAAESDLVHALRAIEQQATQFDGDVRLKFVPALEAIVKRPAGPRIPLFDGDPRPDAQAALDALVPQQASPTAWLALPNWPARRAMILSLARRGDATEAPTLIASAQDPDPRIRASVAVALSYWVTEGVAASEATEALTLLLNDSGTLVARSVVDQWPDGPDERVRPLATLLTQHPSAHVRAVATAALAGSSPVAS